MKDKKAYIILNKSDFIYTVLHGKADLFFTKIQNGEISGRKHFIAQFEKGEIFTGFECNDELCIIISNYEESELKKQSIDEFLKNDNKEEISKKFNNFINKISYSLFKSFSSEETVVFDKTGEFSVEKNSYVKCSQEILWISVKKGGFNYFDNEKIQINNENIALPLNRKIFVLFTENSDFTLNKTSEILQKTNRVEILKSFCDILYFFINDFIAKKHIIEKESLIKRSKNDSNLDKVALLKLSAILEDETREYQGESQNPLIYAFEVLGKYIDKKIKIPDNINSSNNLFDEIIKNSDLAVRKVLLKENWYKKDNGPLLACFEKDDYPIALIPETPQKYMVYSAGEPKYILSEEKASKIKLQAYMVYTTFSHNVINIMELIKFSLKASWKTDKISIIIMGMLAGLMGAVTPVVTGKLIDTVIPSADRGQLATFAAVLISSAIAAFIFQMVKAIALLRVEGKTDGAVQAAVWTRLLNLPPTFFKDYSTGDLAQRAMGINAIRQILSGSTLNTIMAGVFSGFNLFLMFYYNKKLALLGFILTITAIIFSAFCSVKSLKI
ncbi:MAG: ABC transporter ATP-binding protein, partial [Candidatus Muirbacterium halophilum]|nr:ABC transporter ATP-binding protein [Candidatus Muirbacterium halophilum]